MRETKNKINKQKKQTNKQTNKNTNSAIFFEANNKSKPEQCCRCCFCVFISF